MPLHKPREEYAPLLISDPPCHNSAYVHSIQQPLPDKTHQSPQHLTPPSRPAAVIVTSVHVCAVLQKSLHSWRQNLIPYAPNLLQLLVGQ